MRKASAPAEAEDDLVGSTLAGMKIVERIGEGGMARVYRAERDGDAGDVAVKVLREDLAWNQEFTRRFEREARAAMLLDHPNTVRTLGFGTDAQRLFIVMELVRGQDLFDILEIEGRVAEARAARIMIEVCDGLHAAHERGIVHRDMKPENVMIAREGGADAEPLRVKVLDFGIAKILDTDAEVRRRGRRQSVLTASGTLIGTPEYVAPEVGRAEPLDARSDLYACGVVLYQLVTGVPPFTDGSPVEIVIRHVHEAPRPPSELTPAIHRGLEKVILKALAKTPADRQQSARELQSELRAVLAELADSRHALATSTTPPVVSGREASVQIADRAMTPVRPAPSTRPAPATRSAASTRPAASAPPPAGPSAPPRPSPRLDPTLPDPSRARSPSIPVVGPARQSVVPQTLIGVGKRAADAPSLPPEGDRARPHESDAAAAVATTRGVGQTREPPDPATPVRVAAPGAPVASAASASAVARNPASRTAVETAATEAAEVIAALDRDRGRADQEEEDDDDDTRAPTLAPPRYQPNDASPQHAPPPSDPSTARRSATQRMAAPGVAGATLPVATSLPQAPLAFAPMSPAVAPAARDLALRGTARMAPASQDPALRALRGLDVTLPVDTSPRPVRPAQRFEPAGAPTASPPRDGRATQVERRGGVGPLVGVALAAILGLLVLIVAMLGYLIWLTRGGQ